MTLPLLGLTPPILSGPDAFTAALASLVQGHDVSDALRGTLVRAFGRQPIVRALWAVEHSTMVLEQAAPDLYLCAPDNRRLDGLRRVFSEAWSLAVQTFGDPPLLLVQHPAVYGPRLAATPTVGLGFVQFPLFPAEGPEEAARAARHETCHAFCWSGRRFLDEGLADRFAGGVSACDDGDWAGPSTRAMIELENGSDLHLERQAPDIIVALRLRRRGVALADALVTRLGWPGVRSLCEDILTRGGGGVAVRVENALGQTLRAWDEARGDVATDPASAAHERLESLENLNAIPAPSQMREIDGLLRDARRQGVCAATITSLLARRAALGISDGLARAANEKLTVAAATVTAAARVRTCEPLRAGGIGLTLDAPLAEDKPGFQLKLDRLNVRPGERVGVIGRNGAGKSTLLSWIAAGNAPELRLDGEAAPQWMRQLTNRVRLGTSLSDYPYHPATRVREAVELHRALYGVPDEEVSAAFDMSAHAQSRLSELSTGWRKILSLFFAFAHNPELVLLDEPSLGLDEDHTRALRRLLDPKSNGRRQTILLSSHVGADLVCLDRTMIMVEGRLVADAGQEDLLNAYGRTKAFVLDPCASEFADELRSLPGLRGVRRDGARLRLYGSGDFSTAFLAMASRLTLVSFGIEPATPDDILTFAMEI